jgi:broad specificity phosphatase PhoE
MSEVELVTDNYPILVAATPLPVIREQAERFRRYLADDSNTFDGSWLEEQQHRLDAVHSYIRNKRVRAEVSQCQRWIELRIGEWLGPAREGFKGNQYSASLPGNEAEINDRHKHEFRFMAEYKAIVADIMENHRGREITRAALIATIEDALLVNHGAVAGSICGADVRAVLAELIQSGLWQAGPHRAAGP